MEKDLPGPMTPFDELVTTPELQMIKLLIPYAPSSGRQMLAAFIKFSELKETLRLFRSPGGLQAQAFLEDDPPASPLDMLNSFRPYLKPQQTAMLDMILNLQEMMPLIEMFRQMADSASDSSADGSDGSSPDLQELLINMLPPQQQEMFRMYSDMFSQSGENSPPGTMPKGDDTDERMDEQSCDEEYRSGETGTDPDGSGAHVR